MERFLYHCTPLNNFLNASSANNWPVIDKLQAFVYGRPPALQEADTFVPMAFADRFEELEQWVSVGDSSVTAIEKSPIYGISAFTRLARLSIVMNRILNTIYRVNPDQQKSTLVVETLNSLNHDLSEWSHSAPPHLSFPPAAVGVSSATVPAPHTYIQKCVIICICQLRRILIQFIVSYTIYFKFLFTDLSLARATYITHFPPLY